MTCCAILAAKGTRHQGNPCVCNGVPSRQISPVRLPKTVIDATMCAIITSFIRDLLDFAGLNSNLAYITSVYLSATSVLTRLVRLSNASLLKKPELGMVEINNQRKAFLDMLAWSGGTDNGRQNQKSWL